MRTLVIGSNGQLGTDLIQELESNNMDYFILTHEDLSVENYHKVVEILSDIKPNVVINTAAFHNVERCEEEPEKAFLINSIGARNIAIVCAKIDCEVVYISTDYVFSGEKNAPYIEFDQPNPLNVYGRSKLSGEKETINLTSKYYIIRTAWLYGKNASKAKGGNFITKILKVAKEREILKVVNDQIGTPTSTKHLAKQIISLIRTKAYGLYHITCQGEASWYDFAVEILKLAGINKKIIPVSSDEFPTKAKRPKYSVLDNFSLRSLGIDKMPDWQYALRKYFEEVYK